MKPIEPLDLQVSESLMRVIRTTFLTKRLVILNSLIVLHGLWGLVHERIDPSLVQASAVIGLLVVLFLAFLYRQRLLLRSILRRRFNMIRAAKLGKKFYFHFQTGDGEELCYKTTVLDQYCTALRYVMYELNQPGPVVFEDFDIDHPFDLDGDTRWSGRTDLEFQVSEDADPENLLRDFPDGQGSMMQRFLSGVDQFTGYFIACGVGLKPDPLEIELSQDVKVVCTVRLIAEPSSAKSAAS